MPRRPPHVYRGNYITRDPIPGLIPMPMGVPFITEVDGDKGCPIFVGCCHNAKTLKRLLTEEEYDILASLMEEFLQKTYGYIDRAGTPIPGLVDFFLNKNSRNADPGNTSTVNGSYSIGGTIIKGEGKGIFAPAVQASAGDLYKIRKRLLELIHLFYRIVVPCCVSRLEWDLTEFHSEDNNVFAVGGFRAGPTSVQTNCSTSFNPSEGSAAGSPSASSASIPPPQPSPPRHSPTTPSNDENPSLPPGPAMSESADTANQTPGIDEGSGDWLFLTIEEASKCATLGEAIRLVFQSERLKTALGKQGWIHGDQYDALTRRTLIAIAFRLAKGKSHTGGFFLIRDGLYIEEFGNDVCFLVFNGRDLHCGESPGGIQRALDDFHSMFPEPSRTWKDQECVNRVVYVGYFSSHAVNRSCTLAMTPEIPFGNYHPRPTQYANFAQQGKIMMGSAHARAFRFAAELYRINNNFLHHTQMNVPDLMDVFKKITYSDERGRQYQIGDALPVVSPETRKLWRSYYQFYYHLCLRNEVTISRSQLKMVKVKIDHATTDAALATLVQPQPLLVASTTSLCSTDNSQSNVDHMDDVMDVDSPVQTRVTSHNDLAPMIEDLDLSEERSALDLGSHSEPSPALHVPTNDLMDMDIDTHPPQAPVNPQHPNVIVAPARQSARLRESAAHEGSKAITQEQDPETAIAKQSSKKRKKSQAQEDQERNEYEFQRIVSHRKRVRRNSQFKSINLT